ncbi:DUF3050 domain-containing protein [Ectothiorhodospiraceae bacterium BW-2]|nr:DUF3050 domain-containing protein [Ectothiorhodospiraceae bacterium BW-2]
MSHFSQELIQQFQQQLQGHPLYERIDSVAALRVYMSHQIFSVWDFMSLIKYLQSLVAPARAPWQRGHDTAIRRFINELTLEEESDEYPHPNGDIEYLSHFELYCRAMDEVGADKHPALQFVTTVETQGIEAALQLDTTPVAAREFTRQTFDFIGSSQPHAVAAALALGREHLIPTMFRALLNNMGIARADAPLFHFYLERHIHLDEDFHAPLSLKLLDALCGDDAQKQHQALQAAHQAVAARCAFWDGIVQKIDTDDLA